MEAAPGRSYPSTPTSEATTLDGSVRSIRVAPEPVLACMGGPD
jgi:hypothetical protein